MVKKLLTINLDESLYNQLHELMGMKVKAKGVIIYQLTEAGSKQQFYREVMRAGIKSKLKEFEDKKKDLEYEIGDSN